MRRRRSPRRAAGLAVLLLLAAGRLGASAPAVTAEGWRARALAHLEDGEYAASRRAAERAVAAARRTADSVLLGRCLDALGNACFYLLDYRGALEHFTAGLEAMRAAGDRGGEALLLRDLGITENNLDLPDRALAHLLTAAEAYAASDPEGPPGALYSNLGSLYARVGADRLALAAFRRAMEIAERKRSPALLVDVATRLGTLDLDLGQPESARVLLEATYRGLGEGVELVQRAWLLEFLAVARQRCGDADGAEAAYREGLAISRRLGHAPNVQFALVGLGEVRLARDPQAAAALFEEALAIGGRRHWPALAGLARLRRLAGDPRGALALDREALTAFLTWRGTRATAADRRRQTAFGRSLAEALVADLLDLDAGGGDRLLVEEALVASDSLRAPELEVALADERLDLESEQRARLEDLEERVRALRRRLLAGPQPAVGAELGRDLERAQLELDLLYDRARGRREAPALGITALQRALPADAALLAYWVTEAETVLFVLTAEHVEVERLPLPQAELAARVENALALVAQDQRRGWEPTLARLYRDLVAPVRRRLPAGTTRLVVVPDGPLAPLPFEALVAGRSGGRPLYLVEEFTVSYAPSAGVFARLRARAARRGGGRAARPLAVLAEPLLDAAAPGSPAASTRLLYAEEGFELRPLTHVAREAAALAPYAGRGGTVLTGAAASETWIKAAPLARYGVLHFATHSILSRWEPARSAVVLASGPAGPEDGFLQAREVRRLRLRSDLVVLAACRTGRSESLRGGEAEGLAVAFLEAGADSVLASLAELDDAAAADLAVRLYRHLARGAGKAEALRAAKRELLARPPRVWAPLVLVGDPMGEVPLAAAPVRRRPVLWGIALAAALFALARARARRLPPPPPPPGGPAGALLRRGTCTSRRSGSPDPG